MALAPYFARTAVAAAQALHGYDENAIRERLGGTLVALCADEESMETAEGRLLADMACRLLARFYPQVSLRIKGPRSGEVAGLAVRINPEIELTEAAADIEIAIGAQPPKASERRIFAGSRDWLGTCSWNRSQAVGDSPIPFGAGAAACMAVGEVFRAVFVEQQQLAFPTAMLDTYRLQAGENAAPRPVGPITMGSAVLAGAGAIGQAAVWALSQAPLMGELTIVDHESIEMGNLQRYVLAEWDSIDAQKARFAAGNFARELVAVPRSMTWREFAAATDHCWPLVLVALDTAKARREVQAGLPKSIVNAWTQPGDLGISTHPHLERGACLRCLYFPDGPLPNEDQLIAAALQLPHAEHGLPIRRFLHTDEGLPADFLQLVADALGQPFETLAPYVGKPIRTLYVEGICGGAVLPLDTLGRPADAVQVPIAHQSALAGILLAARATALQAGLEMPSTEVARVDVMSSPGSWSEYMSQPAGKNPTKHCICMDDDYVNAYRAKYEG